MPPPPPLPGDPLAPLARPIALTRAAMLAERLLRAFWPLLSLAAVTFTLLAFRLPDHLGAGQWPVLAGALGFLAVVLAAFGLRRFRIPTRAEAIARLDATLPGRPLAALTDSLTLGETDPATRALWALHRGRMAERAAGARAPLPAPDLAPRDPYGLRISALTGVTVALIFGAPLAIFSPPEHPRPPGAAEAAMGPAWEGWAEPPRYTGKPGLYLNGVEGEDLVLPEGTKLSFRFYGAPGSVPFRETVSSPAATPEKTEGGEVQSLDLMARRSGVIEIGGRTGRVFRVTLLSDSGPVVDLPRLAERRADGKLAQPFQARDDYGVVRGQARVSLDLAAVDRRYGLAIAPEPRPDLTFDLPLPITGSRADFTETLIEDMSEHPWANLPVKLSLSVEDGLGQTGTSGDQALDLPGRRFFDPRAAALIELRRDLLWSRENAPRTAQLLRAILNRPAGLFPAPQMAEALHAQIERLEGASLTPEARDEVAKVLWDLAKLLEDGGLADALAAMQQAQERLSEAIRNGASKDEIAKLMAELKEATDRYLQMLAERATDQEEGPQFGQKQDSQRITGDQIQQMMAEIQRLMEEGKMAEAQELLDQLARLMENMKVTQGEGGEGDGPGGKAMKDLGQTLREQQKLSDDAFRQMQRSPQPEGIDPGLEQPGPGGPQMQPDAQPQAGEGAQGDPGESLAGRQHALRRELERQRGLMPRLDGEAARQAERALDGAGEAMDGAEQALKEGDLGGALDRQADAIEALREGLRQLGEALAEEGGQGQTGQGAQGMERRGDATGGHGERELPRDPLGRATGEGSRIGTDSDLLKGDDIYRRARDLLDEIRRRTAERSRPEPERDYLRRLLDRFATP
ncbi:DUF4175 domain-containing protein [Rhodobacter capsulatus]|uniref:TIGR02302 family protein n=1 Tax=Rhodobacter capsulatus (strain ATCC BAA-309 / NBRC 16581 / SB1003) TaxID=272942 RepID=D5AR89_RHOCB|nr:DUF4175 domain-containing protein [Rhodobacter capsulatus]ADE86894.1 conserved hypothetical protein [Rhodobacter capsulatus SB 1003]ETD00428.1 ATPase [Rhodobacter capsulatus DE442]ETD74768.1 ATPase [Rhodobacter capsulatus R121]ETE52334.1 ATPase [Rhodobacter capsulatus Y262]MDS0928694.1 DUF4175 domain-containing protein [Rhodobacter capsulatus]